MSRRLVVRNRQRTRPLDPRLLRRIAQTLLRELCRADNFELGIYLVAADEISRLNQQFLKHQGPTDVITFDYSEGAALQGELFICVDEAVRHARRYRTGWESELVRYLIHGVLHLQGFVDRPASARRLMKRREDLFLRRLGRRFDFAQLALPW